MFLNNYLVIRGKYLPGASDVSEMDVVASLKVLPLLLRDVVISCAKVRNIIITAKENSKEKSLFSIFLVFYPQMEGKYRKVIYIFILER